MKAEELREKLEANTKKHQEAAERQRVILDEHAEDLKKMGIAKPKTFIIGITVVVLGLFGIIALLFLSC